VYLNKRGKAWFGIVLSMPLSKMSQNYQHKYIGSEKRSFISNGEWRKGVIPLSRGLCYSGQKSCSKASISKQTAILEQLWKLHNFTKKITLNNLE
tara:strand:- start:463 stop:747 length:285 start_codon:yes stop_codon:yes gene_type:complete